MSTKREILSTTDAIMAEAETVADAALGSLSRTAAIGLIAKAILNAERRGVESGIQSISDAMKVTA